MRRYIFYFAVALLAFGIGLVVAFVSYLRTDINVDSIVEQEAKQAKAINKLMNEIESENTGFAELSNAKNGDSITVQGYIDEKFLCHDVTDSQTDVCSTVLIGNSQENKSLLIRLKVCDEKNQSNCIVWKPGNLCPNNDFCSNQIRIYDNDSKFVELIERIGKNSFTSKNIQLKVTGRVSNIGNTPRLMTPIEKLEFIEMR